MTARERPLRVVYVVTRLDPGGAERQMLALAERLPRDEFRVDFICTSEPGIYAERARAAGAGVLSLGESPPTDGSVVDLTLRRLRKVARYLRALRRNRYDIVDAWMYPAYDIAALSRLLTGIPVVIAGRRSLGEIEPRYGAAERMVHLLARNQCALTVANSRAAADRAIEVERLDPDRVRVIHNGVELIEPLTDAERRAIRGNWSATDKDVVIGCVANYRAVKALDLLIGAFASIVAQHPRARLVLVGEGPERPRLEALIGTSGLGASVTLHGREPEARRLYPAFDVVALTSASEGLPNAMLEAAAAGRAVVATDVGGVSEVVVDGETGLLVPSGDRARLAAALTRLAGDGELRERFGHAGQERMASSFGMDRFVAEFAALYREVAPPR